MLNRVIKAITLDKAIRAKTYQSLSKLSATTITLHYSYYARRHSTSASKLSHFNTLDGACKGIMLETFDKPIETAALDEPFKAIVP